MNYFSGIIITIQSYEIVYSVFQNSTLSAEFDIDNYQYSTCEQPELQELINHNSSNMFITTVTISNLNNWAYNNLSYTVNNIIDNQYKESIETKNLYLQPLKSYSFYISHECPDILSDSNYWALNNVTIYLDEFGLSFYYTSLCSSTFVASRFDYSYLIIVGVGAIFIVLLSSFGQISSFKMKVVMSEKSSVNNYYYFSEIQIFQGIYINYWYFIAFIVFFLLLTGVSYIKLQIENVIISVISYFLNVFYLIEVLFYFDIKLFRFRHKQFYYMIGIILGSIPTIAYYFYNKSWVVNDIICFLNLGALFKLLKVTSFKDGITIYIPFIIFLVILNLLIYNSDQIGYDIDELINFTSLVSLQAPMLEQVYRRKCAFIEINTFFLPGLMVAYTLRYAKSSNVWVYFIVYVIGMVLGLVAWIFSTFLKIDFMIPSLIFSVGISSLISYLLSYKRNEQRQFWSGFFYDEILLNPFKKDNLTNITQVQELVSMKISQNLNEKKNEIVVELDEKIFNGLEIQ